MMCLYKHHKESLHVTLLPCCIRPPLETNVQSTSVWHIMGGKAKPHGVHIQMYAALEQ